MNNEQCRALIKEYNECYCDNNDEAGRYKLPIAAELLREIEKDYDDTILTLDILRKMGFTWIPNRQILELGPVQVDTWTLNLYPHYDWNKYIVFYMTSGNGYKLFGPFTPTTVGQLRILLKYLNIDFKE